MMWSQRVACPERFGTETSEFLDRNYTHGKISKCGTFSIKEPLGELVPYELLPLRVKKAVNLMPIDRSKFKKVQSFKAALVNLFIYGYMPDVDQAIVARERHWRDFRRRWQIDHPESVQNTANKQRAKQIAWGKTNEDVALFHSTISVPAIS